MYVLCMYVCIFIYTFFFFNRPARVGSLSASLYYLILLSRWKCRTYWIVLLLKLTEKKILALKDSDFEKHVLVSKNFKSLSCVIFFFHSTECWLIHPLTALVAQLYYHYYNYYYYYYYHSYHYYHEKNDTVYLNFNLCLGTAPSQMKSNYHYYYYMIIIHSFFFYLLICILQKHSHTHISKWLPQLSSFLVDIYTYVIALPIALDIFQKNGHFSANIPAGTCIFQVCWNNNLPFLKINRKRNTPAKRFLNDS